MQGFVVMTKNLMHKTPLDFHQLIMQGRCIILAEHIISSHTHMQIAENPSYPPAADI